MCDNLALTSWCNEGRESNVALNLAKPQIRWIEDSDVSECGRCVGLGELGWRGARGRGEEERETKQRRIENESFVCFRGAGELR
jgi:hypothetical protein